MTKPDSSFAVSSDIESSRSDSADALGGKTARASLLSVSSKLVAKLLGFTATLVLARMLSPEDFGLVAVALMAFGLLEVLRNMGTGEALIYQQRYRDVEATSAFWIALVTGITMSLTFVFGAPVIASLFNNLEAASLIKFMGWLFIVEALGAIPAALAKRDLDFGTLAYAEVGRALSKALLSIALALSGFGVWSIIYGQLLGSIVGVAIYWKRIDWRPSFAFDWQASKGMLSYGLVLVGVGVMAFVVNRIDQLIIARRLDMQQLGYFVMAYTFANMLITDLAYNAGQASCSTFAKVQSNSEELKKFYLATVFWHSLFGFAFAVGLAITAPLVVGVLLAEKWQPIVPVLQALSIHALISTLSIAPADLITATGRAKYVIYVNLGWIIVSVPTLLILAERGIVAVAWGVTFLEFISLFVMWALAKRLSDHRNNELLSTLKTPLIASLSMALCLFGLHHWHGMASMPIPLLLASTIIVGAVVYLGAVFVLRPDTYALVIGAFKKSARV